MSVGLKTIVMTFGAFIVLTEKSMVLKVSSLSSSCASSSTHRLTPWMDFSLAIWLPEEVLRPRNNI